MEDRVQQLVTRVVEAWSAGEASAAASSIRVGQLAHRAVRAGVLVLRDKKSRRTQRAEILETIATQLQAAGHRARASHMARHIRVAMVAQCYGIDAARKQPIPVLRAFATTIRRDTAKEAWSVKGTHEEAARGLWERVVGGDLQPVDVPAAIDNMLDRKPRAPKPKPTLRDRAARLIAQLSADDQQTIYRALAKRFGPVVVPTSTVKQTSPIPDTIPMPEPPAKPGLRKRILG